MPEERQVSPYRMEHNVPNPWLLEQSGPAKLTNADLRRFWITLYKRRVLIVAATLLVLLFTVMLEQSTPRVYTAAAKIRIDPVSPAVTSLNDIAALLVDGSYYQTEYVILQSPAIAKRVIEALKLYDDPRFTSPPEATGPIADLRDSAARAWRVLRQRLESLGVPTPLLPHPSADTKGTPGEDRARPWVELYLAALVVSPIENSRLVTISYTSPFRDLAASIANEHAKQFIRMSLEAREDLNSEAQKLLEQRLEEIRKRSEESEAKLNEFRRQHRVLAVGGNEKDNVALEQLASLTADYAKAQSERIVAESEYSLVKRRQYDQLAVVQRDAPYNSLKEQLEQLKSEQGRLSQIYTANYPKMKELAKQIELVERRIAEQIHRSVAGVESQYLAAKEKEEALATEISRQRKAVLDFNDLNVEYQVLFREAEANRELYKNLVTRASEAGIAGTIQSANVRVVEHADLPTGPSFLGARRNLSRALFLGIILGVALAFAIEYLDSAVKNPDDAESLLRLPTLAVVPSFSYAEVPYASEGGSRRRSWLRRRVGRRPGRRKSSRTLVEAEESGVHSIEPRRVTPSVQAAASLEELVVMNRPRSVIAEAYRTLRTAVLLSSADKPPRVIQVASAGSREGKTVTSVNTAFTLAQSGARVVVVDADLRRPRCHRMLGTSRTPGLVDYLVGHSSMEDCLRGLSANGDSGLHAVPKTGASQGDGEGNGRGFLVGSVDLLPSGTPAPNPAELLGSERMGEMLQQLRELYDYVVIDSPPVLPVADSVILGTMVDAVVLVIRGQATSKELVRQAFSKLARVNVHVIGSVLNNVDVTSGDYYYYRGYYSSYGGYLEGHDTPA